MPAARCSMCGLNFPSHLTWNPCPACDSERLDYVPNDEPHDEEYLSQRVREGVERRAHALKYDAFVEHYIKTRGHHPDFEEPEDAV